MCIAILKPEGKRLSRKCLESCYNSNRDGAGFAYYDPAINEVCIRKGYFNFDKFYEEFNEFQHLKCLVHFRVATHREVNGKNCHPWRVNDDLVFIHNGTISGMSSDSSLSDTGNFCNDVVKQLLEANPEFYKHNIFKWLIENSVGTWNKLIFLSSDGFHLIANEKEGHWDSGCWFSTTAYKPFNCTNFSVLERTPEEIAAEAEEEALRKETEALTPAVEAPELELPGSIDLKDIDEQLTKNGMAEVFSTEAELDAALEKLNADRFARH
jgi:predicted glutamine amidotransferase